jgi:hypothetical protein
VRTADGGLGRENDAPGLGDEGRDGLWNVGDLGDAGSPTRGALECIEVADSGSYSVGA